MSETSPIPPSTRIIYNSFDFVGRNWLRIVASLGGLGVVAVLASGFYIVKKEEQGVVTRFGKVIDAEVGPGINYCFPFVEEVHIRPVKRIIRREVASKSGDKVNFTILSGDTNLLEIDVALQYRVDDLRNYLFAAAEPEKLLTMVVREELVEVIGQNFIDLIFTSNRSIIEKHLFKATAESLADIGVGVGIELTSLAIVDVRPIDETLAAFRDVNDAIAERAQAESEANRKRERFLARSRGQAQALILNANARAKERVTQARGAAQAFTALLDEYRSQPAQVAVTRYWQRMRTIFAQASLAAVNPGDTSTIDINMVDGAGALPVDMTLGSPASGRSRTGERVLASSTSPTELNLGRGIEMNQLTMDGRFHDKLAERDHLGVAKLRSLIFDSPSIFAHRDVPRVGPVLEKGAEQRPLVETIPTEGGGGSEPGEKDHDR